MRDVRASLLRVVHGLSLALMLVVILFPVYWMVAGSLKTEAELFSIPPRWIWTPTFAAYADAIQNSNVLTTLLNLLIVVLASVALGLLVGAPAAYGLARYRFRGRRDVWFWYVTN